MLLMDSSRIVPWLVTLPAIVRVALLLVVPFPCTHNDWPAATFPVRVSDPSKTKFAAPVEPVPMTSPELLRVTVPPIDPPLKLNVAELTVSPPLAVSVPDETLKVLLTDELAAKVNEPLERTRGAVVSVNELMD